VEWSARIGADRPPESVVPPAQCSVCESMAAAMRDSLPVSASMWVMLKFVPSVVT
jgi:hypothetical protein